jgi:hypothetical protein
MNSICQPLHRISNGLDRHVLVQAVFEWVRNKAFCLTFQVLVVTRKLLQTTSSGSQL